MLGQSREAARVRRILISLYLLALAFGLCWPLFGFFDQHEAYCYFQRLEVLAEGWRGQGVHPRWSTEMAAGHGYPLFNYYPPGFSYIGLLFYYPFGVIWAVKLAGMAVTIAGVFFAYGLGRSLAGVRGGLLAATLCLTAPYTYCNLYWRGDFGEYSAFFGAIGVLWALIAALRRGAPLRGALVFAAAYGAFVPLHTISSLLYSGLFALFAGGYALTHRFGIKAWARMVGAFAGGLALSAWYWLPALAEKPLVSTANMLTGYYEIEHHFAQWPRYFSAFTWEEPFLGPVVVGSLVLVAVVSLRRRRYLPIALAVLAIACIAVNFPPSKPFWENMPLIRYVQFPWRFNGPAVLLSAAAATACVRLMPRKVRRMPILAATLLLGVVAVAVMLQSTRVLPRLAPEADVAVIAPDRWITTSARNEFLPRTAVPTAVHLGAPLVETGASVLWAERQGTDFSTAIDASTDTTVTFRQWAHDGWHAYVNEAEVECQADAAGRIMVPVPPGRHEVRIELRRTTIQCASEWISVLSLFAALAGAAWLVRKRAVDRGAGVRRRA